MVECTKDYFASVDCQFVTTVIAEGAFSTTGNVVRKRCPSGVTSHPGAYWLVAVPNAAAASNSGRGALA